MRLNLVVYLLVLSIILTNVVFVVSIEPISMTIGAAVVGKHNWEGDDIISHHLISYMHMC